MKINSAIFKWYDIYLNSLNIRYDNYGNIVIKNSVLKTDIVMSISRVHSQIYYSKKFYDDFMLTFSVSKHIFLETLTNWVNKKFNLSIKTNPIIYFK